MMEELSAGDDLRVQAADRIRERDVADHEHREAHHEENFRRTADAIMQDGTMGRRSDQLQDVIKQRELDEAAVRNRLTCRPMFPVPLWEQRQHYATPYGYFAQGCEKGTGFHSARRMGEDMHRPDEK